MHGMIAWFARNGVAANLLMFVILAAGAYSLAKRIPLEVFPSFETDAITISMTYRGATPAEVEEGLVARIEEAIADLEGIEEIRSNANEGVASIRVEVDSGVDSRALLDDIKGRVDAISTFPEEADEPVFGIVEFQREVISIVIAGTLPEAELRRLGERVRDDVVALDQVSKADLVAVRPYEIAIEVKPETLQQYDLTIGDLARAIERWSVDLPAGSIRTTGGEVLLRTLGQAYTAEQYGEVVILNRTDGSRLRLRDIATIHDGFDEQPLAAEFNGQRAVMIEAYRAGDKSAIAVGRQVKDFVTAMQYELPQGVSIDYWRDRSRIVQLRLNTLLNSAMQGGALIFLALALFLRFSVAIWVCVGIPVSFMGALALMPEMGVTINLVSLFAFILVLGIVVDDAIITGENIYTHMKNAEEAESAAITGTQEVAVPVTFGILTTVAAFTPLFFVEGVRGQIFAQIPAIVIPVLLFSWVESKLILPAHMKHVHLDRAKGARRNVILRAQRAIADGLERFVARYYHPVLDVALRWRMVTLALFVAGSMILFAFVASGRYGFTFFPRVQSETATATLVMPAGTPAETTFRHIDTLDREARALRDKYIDPLTGASVVRHILVAKGWSGGGRPGIRGQAEVGQVVMELVPPEERALEITSSEIVREWRRQIGTIPGAKELSYRAEIGRAGDPIDIQLAGDDFDKLGDLAAKIKQRLAEYPGVFDIKDTLEDGKEEVVLTVKPEAEFLGLSASELGRQVREAFFGAEVQRIQRGRDDVRVIIRYPEADRKNLSSLETMRVRTAEGVEVPIGNVASVDLGRGFSTIRRIDRHRIANITADVEKGKVDVNQIMRDMRTFLDGELRNYPGVRYSTEGELREQRETFGSVLYGVMFVLFAIYALLAIPFKSYVQPIVVMLVIPFSIVGALLGHMLMGMSLSIMSIMGMLALAGVVVNDSLVLVDYINRRRSEGVDLDVAIRTAGVARFRPILLTSLTTFVGLVPLIFEKSTQAQFLIPMAVSLGFGILYATLLSLLLVPVGYRILEDIRIALGLQKPEPAGLEDGVSNLP